MGKVYFVGAGPGDPELITLRGYRILKEADVVIYTGSLINPKILDFAEKAVDKIDSFGMNVEQICSLMIRYVRGGKKVVRLHDGDPSIFGSIKEQIEILEENNVDFEIIPGVSSFLGASASLRTELTAPDITQTIVITRYPGRTPVPEDIIEIAKQKPTMVFFLSAHMIEKISNSLMKVGYSPDFPCAVCYRVSWPDEKILFGTLDDIYIKAKEEGIDSQALFIVSKVFQPQSKGAKSFVYSKAYSDIVRKAKEKGKSK